jgi:hypothetical protein
MLQGGVAERCRRDDDQVQYGRRDVRCERPAGVMKANGGRKFKMRLAESYDIT